MADSQCGAHTDVQADSTFEFLGNQLAGRIGNRLQAFDEQSGDTRNQLHYGAHLDTQT